MMAPTAQRNILFGGRNRSRSSQDRPGDLSVDHQSVEFGFWLGIAVLALVWAYLQIWHARRALDRIQPEGDVPQGRSVPSAVAELARSVVAR